MKRTQRCGELRKEHVGQTVTVCGWVDTKREMGHLVFIDLRDIAGKVQLAFDLEKRPEIHAAAKNLHGEYVIQATGTLRARDPKNVNARLATGEIEIDVTSLEVLNTAKTPAIEVRDEIKTDPEIRLKHRFIDLRRRPMQRILQARAAMIRSMRATLDAEQFTEIETPILYKRTPEGARDFIVPSRAYPGQFYALPQSPQLFKQLCMVAGLDRYYQIARCFRDEDKRADRQPEFTQLDIEMSFNDREDVMGLLEKVVPNFVRALQQDPNFKDCDWPVLKCGEVKAPFERMTYETAMRDYSIDRPDLRSRDLRLTELTAWAKTCSFNAFKGAAEAGLVKALRCPGMAEAFSRGQISNLERDAKGMGASGLASLTVGAPVSVGATYMSPLQGAIAKFIPAVEQDALVKACKAQPGDLIFICAHAKEKVVHAVMHNLRTVVAQKLGLLDPSKFALVWIIDFPLFEYKEEEEKLYASHHPFTLAQDMELVRKLAEAARKSSDGSVISRLKAAGFTLAQVLGIRNNQYDLVLNGTEIAGGSIRMHRTDWQEDVFELVGITKEEAEKKFGFLMNALAHGAPPHGGVAMGIERNLMCYFGLENIQEVMAFPKSATGRDLMIDTPNDVEPKLLKELGIEMTPQK
ncbi:MAG: aspartate--tRNA ligase [Planctomycetes bacterium]|nr:aspartate--tRNA ligase [Planctomycetota bacterium]